MPQPVRGNVRGADSMFRRSVPVSDFSPPLLADLSQHCVSSPDEGAKRQLLFPSRRSSVLEAMFVVRFQCSAGLYLCPIFPHHFWLTYRNTASAAQMKVRTVNY